MIKNRFIDRKPQLALLEKRIRDFKEGYRQNIALIGDEYVGKTSIIFNFLSEFCDNRIITLYIENRIESFDSFAKRFIGVLLYNYFSNTEIELKEDLDFLISKASGVMPKTVEKINALLLALKKRKTNDLFSELLSLCDSVNLETNKLCVIIFDEFHNLENLNIKNLYPAWSKILISQKNTMFILISSMKYRARNILAKNLSLLFGNFETINLEPFDIKVSEQFIEARCFDAEIKIEPNIKSFIVNFTNGSPFYLKLITDAYLNSQNKNLSETLLELLFEPSGSLHQRFSTYLQRFLSLTNSQDYVNILQLISQGHNKIKDIAQLLHKTQKDALPRINYLLESDCINKSGDFLSINDRVLAFWLKFVYQGKNQSLTFNAVNQKALFIEKVNLMIKDFLNASNKPVSERIQELLRLFCDETILIEKKKIRLTHFREVKPLEFNHPGIKEGLIGRSSDELWIIAFKKEPLNEEDVTEFAKECRRYRNKMLRKVVITFQDVETNARLRALEEKILTLDLNNLNQIFDLFSKPRIMA